MSKGFKNKKYSEEEEQFLRNNYATLGNKKCAEHLGRTVSAVNHKAKKLGLSKTWCHTYTSVQGYLMDCTDRNKHKLIHRQQMEQKLQRPLTPQEIVHHINGDKQDNDPENLELLTRAEHINLHRPTLMAAKHKR